MTVTIKSIASSSKGNCDLVDDGKAQLLIECGISIKKIKKALNFSLSGISGCLVSHGHGDHIQAAGRLACCGTDVYMSAGTAEETTLEGHRIKIIKPMKQFKIGSWTILPFDTVHDCAEPLGFLMQSGSEKLLFATDTAFIKYKFKGLNYIMVECNYDMKIVDEQIESGAMAPAQKNRLLKSHFGLENVKDFIRANDMSTVREIHLLHLSGGNSDAAKFEREIKEISGVPTYICEE